MIDCSKTANYLSERLRMTRRSKNKGCDIKCSECPLSYTNNGASEFMSCTTFETLYPEKAIAIVQKWSDAHPQKTYLSELLTHFPKVKLDDTGTPKEICPHELGLNEIKDCGTDNCCVRCWNQPIEE